MVHELSIENREGDERLNFGEEKLNGKKFGESQKEKVARKRKSWMGKHEYEKAV